MEKQMSFALSLLLSFLALAGFVKRKKRVLGLMNVDVAHSLLRIPLASLLFLGSKSDLRVTRQIMLGGGIMYLAIATLGSMSRKMFGAFPTKLTRFDLFYHIVGGLGAVWMGTRSGRMMKPDLLKASERI